MKSRYFIVLNNEVVSHCVKCAKAYKIFEHFKTKVNPNCDVLQLWEVGYGIIEEY